MNYDQKHILQVRTTIDIPDEMVKLDTSTMRKLEQGQAAGRKRRKAHGSDKKGSSFWFMREFK